MQDYNSPSMEEVIARDERDYKTMSLSEVIAVTGCFIGEELERQGCDIDYSNRVTLAILSVIDKADAFAAGDQLVGFATASSFLIPLVQALRVQLPRDLEDRLHGRVIRA